MTAAILGADDWLAIVHPSVWVAGCSEHDVHVPPARFSRQRGGPTW